MALQSRGFQINQPAIPAQIDFSQLKPGSFINGLNSGIGTFNAFQNIVDEAQERPLREQERRARLAQIEAEASLAPTRAKMAEINLNRASLPDQIVTGTTATRVPRADNPMAYDITEVVEGFEFNPATGERVPFKRQGKVIATAEDIANKQAIRDAEMARIEASRANAEAEASARAEANRIKNEQLVLAKKKFDDTVARLDKEAETAGWVKERGQDENGNLVVMYTNPRTGEQKVLGADLKISPIRAPDPLDRYFGGPGTGIGTGIGGTPQAPAPAPAVAAPVSASAAGDEDLLNAELVKLPSGFTMEIAP